MAIDADPRMILTRTASPAARTTSYGPDTAQVYDVRLPNREARGMTVVVIHGGFWAVEFDRAHAEVRRTVIPACEHFGLIGPDHPALALVLDAVRSFAP